MTAPHWSDLPGDTADGVDRPDTDSVVAPPTTLAIVARRIADVSPDWAERVVEPGPGAAANEPEAGIGRDRALGVEEIREGWLLHRAASRVAPATSPDLALLIGDWCYADGLCTITDHGSLDDVARLAGLVADVSLRCDETTEQLAPRWSETVEAMRRG